MTTMDANTIIEGLEEFFKNASPEDLEEIREAFSVEIDGDVSIDEYLSRFGDEYFYTEVLSSSCYESELMTVGSGIDSYGKVRFDVAENEYTATIDTDSEYGAFETKKIKKAA